MDKKRTLNVFLYCFGISVLMIIILLGIVLTSVQIGMTIEKASILGLGGNLNETLMLIDNVIIDFTFSLLGISLTLYMFKKYIKIIIFNILKRYDIPNCVNNTEKELAEKLIYLYFQGKRKAKKENKKTD